MTELEIRVAPRLPRDDRVALFQFEIDPWSVEDLGLSWREPDLSFGGYVEGRPVSHVGLLFHPLDLGESQLLVAGISAFVDWGLCRTTARRKRERLRKPADAHRRPRNA